MILLLRYAHTHPPRRSRNTPPQSTCQSISFTSKRTHSTFDELRAMDRVTSKDHPGHQTPGAIVHNSLTSRCANTIRTCFQWGSVCRITYKFDVSQPRNMIINTGRNNFNTTIAYIQIKFFKELQFTFKSFFRKKKTIYYMYKFLQVEQKWTATFRVVQFISETLVKHWHRRYIGPVLRQ